MANHEWLGRNSHKKHREKAELVWRAKMAFPRLKSVLLQEAAEERKPPAESPWIG
jgi:hypothetical protein